MKGAESGEDRLVRWRLRQHGHAYTSGRREVMEAMRTLDHPSAYDVHLTVREGSYRGSRVSMATVYSALAALEEAGVVVSRHFPKTPALYDTNTDSHVDIRCVKCEEVEEVYPFPLEVSYERLVRCGSSMQNVEVSTVAEGVCRGCWRPEDGGS